MLLSSMINELALRLPAAREMKWPTVSAVEVSRGAAFLVLSSWFFVGRGMAKKDPELDPALYVGAVFGAVV